MKTSQTDHRKKIYQRFFLALAVTVTTVGWKIIHPSKPSATGETSELFAATTLREQIIAPTTYPKSLAAHIQQPKNSDFCGDAITLMVMEYCLGTDLSNNRDISDRLSAIVRAIPNQGVIPTHLLDGLNISFTKKDYNATLKINDDTSILAFNRKVLRNEIASAISLGNICVLIVTSTLPQGHAILLTGYDSESDSFLVHDPLLPTAVMLTADELAVKWSLKYPEATVAKNPNLLNRFSSYAEIVQVPETVTKTNNGKETRVNVPQERR